MSDPNGTPKMSGRNRGGFGGPGFSAARGAALVAVAVIIGIVLLQTIDDGNDGPVGDGGATSSSTTTPPDSTSSTDPGTGSSTTVPPLSPDQVTVRVLNGSGVGGAAGNLTNTLKAKGYKTLVAGDTEAQTGTVVDAKPDKTAACTELADLITGAKVQPMPDPVPGGTDADCIVIIGS